MTAELDSKPARPLTTELWDVYAWLLINCEWVKDQADFENKVKSIDIG